MKKVFVLLFVFAMVASLCACNKSEVSDTQSQETTGATESLVDKTEPPTEGTAGATTTPTEEATTAATEETVPSTEKPTTAPTNEPDTQPTEPVHTHFYSAATCTQPKKCSCGATEGIATGHEWVEATCAAPKTCAICQTSEGNTVDHSFDTEGKCKFCKQILPVAPANIKNREYTLYKTMTTTIVHGVTLHFDLSGISRNIFLTCEEVYGPTCLGDAEEHLYFEGEVYHCVGGNGIETFICQDSGDYIVITASVGGFNIVLTTEVLSNDTLRVVAVSGDDDFIKSSVKAGDIFR